MIKRKVPLKFDTEKVRLELIPPELLLGTGRGLTYGAKKYAAGNWAVGDGFKYSRLYGALQRHLTEFWSGNNIDPESGLCHLDHAACMLSFLMATHIRKPSQDDREAVGTAPVRAVRRLPSKRSSNKRLQDLGTSKVKQHSLRSLEKRNKEWLIPKTKSVKKSKRSSKSTSTA
jgi:hypothetical protein